MVKSRPDPETLRLRYRDAIRATVRDIEVEGRADISEYVVPGGTSVALF